jgi:hypothetical protein
MPVYFRRNIQGIRRTPAETAGVIFLGTFFLEAKILMKVQINKGLLKALYSLD